MTVQLRINVFVYMPERKGQKSIPKCVNEYVHSMWERETEKDRERMNEWFWPILNTGSLCLLHLSCPFSVFPSWPSSHFWQWNYSLHLHFLHFNSVQFKSMYLSLNRCTSVCLQWFSLDRGISGDLKFFSVLYIIWIFLH